MTGLAFLHPAYLLLVLLVPVFWLRRWRGRTLQAGTGLRLLRTALLVLLAVGLARPVTTTADAAPTRVWILDRSASVGTAVDARTAAPDLFGDVIRLRTTDPGRDVLVAFGGDLPEGAREVFDRVVDVAADGPDGNSPLSAALLRAAGEIPDGAPGGIVVRSDALDTRADDGRAMATLRHRDIPVSFVPLPARAEPRAVDLQWSGDLRVGATARLTAIVAGRADAGRVVLADAEGELASAPFTDLDGRALVDLGYEPALAGFHDVLVRVEAAGTSTDPDGALAVTLPVQDPRRVLYLGDRQRGGAGRLAELLGRGFAVMDAASVMTSDAAAAERALAEADLVMLDDVAIEAVPDPLPQLIAHAVTDQGVGLVMSGGRSSFGAGGWHDTPIETLLPVELVQKEEKRDPSTTLVLIIDTSGSMSGNRVQLAKEVARLAMRRLMPHDKVGIVEFYGAKRWAAPIQPASNAIELERALNRLDAGGGTVILPAIEEAFYGMQNVDTRYKHVLVLTDGGVEAGAFEPLLRRMSDEGINVTTVLVGGGIHSEFLVDLANWGKGRFYSVPDRFSLPEILFKQPSSAKLPSYRTGTHAVRARGGSGWWGDALATGVPDLAGYVETKARPQADVLLETVDGAHPVIATWRRGLGRVTTIATEPVGDGTEPWNDWPGYGQALARLLDRTGADGRDAFAFDVHTLGGTVTVTAQRLVSDADLRPVLERADGATAELVPLERRAPDTWVARIDAPSPGIALPLRGHAAARLEAPRPGSPGRGAIRLVGRAGTRSESQVDPKRADVLTAMVERTGGAWLSAGSKPPVSRDIGVRLRSLAPWLLGAALVLFLLELVWRRWPR